MTDYLEAIYEDTDELCWVNMNFVIDVFCRADKVIAYVFDNERRGYLISREDFERYRKEQE